MYDASNNLVYTDNISSWGAIEDIRQQMEESGTVVDGDDTLATGILAKVKNGVKKVFYPISHAKAIWYSIKENKTVYDVIAGLLTKTNELSETTTALTEKTEWTKVSFVGASESIDNAISSGKCASVPNTAKEIVVDITVKRNAATQIKFSQSIKAYGEYVGGYYNSEKYYASYQIAYRRDIIMLYKSWLKVVDNGTTYDNSDTVQVDVYYR